MITVYGYDPNGYYSGEVMAREDPLNPGTYLMPARTTTDPPSAVGTNEIARWNGSAWGVDVDFRGTWYDVDNQSSTRIFDAGVAQPPNTTDVVPPAGNPTWVFTGSVWERTLDVAKAEKRNEILTAYDTARAAPISFDGKQFDPSDVFVLFVLSSTEVGGGMQDVFDITHDTFQYDASTMSNLRDAVFNAAKALVINREVKLKAIDDAADIPSVDSISW